MREKSQGAVLVITLVVVTILLTMLLAVVAVAGAGVRSARFWRDWVLAVYVTESGIGEALYRLRHGEAPPLRRYLDEPPSFTAPPGLLGDGAGYQVWIEPDPVTGQAQTVISVGTVGKAARVVSLGVRPVRPVVFPDGLVSTGCQSELEFRLPPGLGPGRALVATRGDIVLEAGTYWFTRIDLSGSTRLVVKGPVIIFLTGDLIAFGSVWFNTSQKAQDLVIIVPGREPVSVSMTGSVRFYGGLYAASSPITLSGSLEAVGSLVGCAFSITGACSVRYDPALAELELPGLVAGAGWQVVPESWGERR
ncbi:MAG: hypothetical protein AB1445_14820 [Bacillota bacterium]